jgi:hypothetical protein
MDYDVLDYSLLLREEIEPPCLSLYQPTHRHFPDNQQDQIRFRNLLKTLEESLKQKYPNRAVKPLLEPFKQLADDPEFWNHTLDGLAVLASADQFRVYRLQRPVAELAVAADSFHTKPLMRIAQSADRYHILGINRQTASLYEGNRDALDQVELPPNVPATLEAALGDTQTTEKRAARSSFDSDALGATTRHGKDMHQHAIDRDTEQFFRAVDRAILENYSRPNGIPLLLAALPEHHNLFRRVSQNPYLARESLDVHPDSISTEELQKRTWEIMLPRYLERLAGLVNAFADARSKGLGTDDLAEAATAAVGGRIATLLIEADRIIPGRIDADTGKISREDLGHPEVDDLLDDLGELVIRTGGEVIIVPKERMPTQTGIAATYRF